MVMTKVVSFMLCGGNQLDPSLIYKKNPNPTYHTPAVASMGQEGESLKEHTGYVKYVAFLLVLSIPNETPNFCFLFSPNL